MINKRKLTDYLTNKLVRTSQKLRGLSYDSRTRKEIANQMDLYKGIIDSIDDGEFNYPFERLEDVIEGFDDLIK